MSFWGKVQIGSLPSIKASSALSLCFLSCNTTHPVCRHPHTLFTSSCGNWGLENLHKNDDILATSISYDKEIPSVSF